MGVWDVMYSIGDGVKAITSDLSTVKRAGSATYHYTSAAVTKIDQVVRVNGIQKLPQYWPDGEARAQIGVFTTTLAKNTAKHVVYEGFKHIPGVSVAIELVSKTTNEIKLVSKTKNEVRNENQNDPVSKAVQQAKVERSEEALRNLTSQPKNRKLRSKTRSRL